MAYWFTENSTHATLLFIHMTDDLRLSVEIVINGIDSSRKSKVGIDFGLSAALYGVNNLKLESASETGVIDFSLRRSNMGLASLL